MHKINYFWIAVAMIFWGLILYYGLSPCLQSRSAEQAVNTCSGSIFSASDSISAEKKSEGLSFELDKNYNIIFKGNYADMIYYPWKPCIFPEKNFSVTVPSYNTPLGMLKPEKQAYQTFDWEKETDKIRKDIQSAISRIKK